MEILILSSLIRRPMHGYEIKTELRYKHVKWWAKCDHGHLYATLPRLESKGLAEVVKEGRRKTYRITDAGRAYLLESLRALPGRDDETFFEIDLFVSCSFLLPQQEVLDLLAGRREALADQLEVARALKTSMGDYVPAAAHLIMEHRARHLQREIEFTHEVERALRAQERWGSFVQDRPIQSFVEQTGVALED